MDITVVSKAEALKEAKNARRDTQPLPADSAPMEGLNRHLRRRQLYNERQNRADGKKSSWFSW